MWEEWEEGEKMIIMSIHTPGWQAQLSANHLSIFVAPQFVTDGPPLLTQTNLHPPLSFGDSTHQPNFFILEASYCKIYTLSKSLV